MCSEVFLGTRVNAWIKYNQEVDISIIVIRLDFSSKPERCPRDGPEHAYE